MISIKDNKIRWAISAILALLILFGTYRNVFSLAAFLIMGLLLVFCDRETNLLQIFFVVPMANIFKFSPGVQSFFTIILLVFVVLHLVLPRRATFVVIMFTVYILIGQLLVGQFNFFRTVKLVCSLLFLSSILNNKVEVRNKEIFLSYIIGNLVSSVFGLMDSSFFKIESYIGTAEFAGASNETDILRFSGLYPDPNYYSVCIIVSMCLLLILYHKKEISAFSAALIAAPMIYFLIITYSKSAIIMLLVFFAYLMYSLMMQKKHFYAAAIIIMLVMVIVLALSGRISLLETVIARFMNASSGEELDVNALTTGRTDIWMMYLKYILKNFNTAVFGDGISVGFYNQMAAHNTYIDIFRHLGVVGGLLLFASLKMILSDSIAVKKERNLLNYSVLICVLVMYFFLSELFYIDAQFHLFIAFTVMNLTINEKSFDKIGSKENI